MTEDLGRCQESVHRKGIYRSKQCSFRAVVVDSGVPHCKIHSDASRQATRDRWQREWDKEKKQMDRNNDIKKLGRLVFQHIDTLLPMLYLSHDEAVEEIIALAKKLNQEGKDAVTNQGPK